MKRVLQATDKSCYLACLESFFADQGEEITQLTMIDDFPIESHKDMANAGEFDFTPENNNKVCAKYRIQIAHRHADFNRLREGDFLDARRIKTLSARHIVRFVKRIDPDHIQVMDPKTGDFDVWSESEFHSYETHVFNVSRSEPHKVVC